VDFGGQTVMVVKMVVRTIAKLSEWIWSGSGCASPWPHHCSTIAGVRRHSCGRSPDHCGQWGGMSGAFADPDGYVEVAHNPGWTITDDGSIRI
jgi:hypothetical protein